MEFTQDLFDEICERIADGESLRSICDDKQMPSRTSVFKWLSNSAELANQYARAREEQADAIFDDVKDIADMAKPEDVQVARLRIDARKWMAGKLRPKKYGEKLELSGNAEAPLTISVVKYGDD